MAFVAVAVALVPLATSEKHTTSLMVLWFAYGLSALGLYWVFGLAGRFAFSQTFMMALGGYTTAWASREGYAFWLTLVAACCACAAVAWVVGLLLRHASEFLFAIGTLAVTEIGTTVFSRSSSFTGTNGDVSGIPYPSFFGRQLTSDRDALWLVLGVLTAALLLTALMERSPLRRACIAGRESTMVARSAGVPVIRAQLVAFAVGSAMGGLSGALIAHGQGFVGVNSFGIDLAIGIFLMLVLGGMRSMWGPVVGAAFYVWMPEFLSTFDRYEAIVYGAFLLVTIMAFPDGLIGLWHRAVEAARAVRARRTRSGGRVQPLESVGVADG